MKQLEILHHVSVIACWLMFCLPLYAIIRSFTRGKLWMAGDRVNLFVRHSVLFQETFLSWFIQGGQKEHVYQISKGEISLHHRPEASPSFMLNEQLFEFGKGSLNPAIDLLENGGVISEGIFYHLTHDSMGRVIRLSVSQEDWSCLREMDAPASVPECGLAGF